MAEENADNLIQGESFLGNGVTSKNNPAGYSWHQFSKLEKQAPADRETEDKKEKITVVPLKLAGYAEAVLPIGLWCRHAFGMGKLAFNYKDAAGNVLAGEWDTAAWGDPYEKHRGEGYKTAFANKRDKEKDPPYKAICLCWTGSEYRGASLASLVGVGRKNSVPYVIDRDGTIYELYDPEEYWGEPTGKNDQKSIGVMLVNRGAIPAEDAEKLKAAGGDGMTQVFTAPEEFRGQKFYQNYTQEQNDQVAQLIRYLCNRFKIAKKFVTGDPTRVNEYLESKAARDLLVGVYAHTNVKDKAQRGVGPAFPWRYVMDLVMKEPVVEPAEPPAPAKTQKPLGTGVIEWPVDIAQYLELATTKDGLTQRKIEGQDPYADLMRISRRVGLDTGEWDPIQEGTKPPYGPFPMFVNGAFNPGVKIGLPTDWGEIAGKLEVRAIADGVVLARGGEEDSDPGKYELGFVVVKHQTPGGQEFFALYMNLAGMDSTEGDVVAAGDYLGLAGAHPRFPHVHLAIASSERIPSADLPDDQQPFGPGAELEEIKACGAEGREKAWGVARIFMPEAPIIFQLAGLTERTYLYHPLHFVRWLRGEKVDLAVANPPIPVEIEEDKPENSAGFAHKPVAMLQSRPFLEEPAIQTFFARTVIKALGDLTKDDMLTEGAEKRGEDARKCVTALQKALLELGFLTGEADGVFGKQTGAAVKSFETAHKEVMVYSDGTKLEPNGDADWVTLKAIDGSLHRIETRPKDVVMIQTENPRTTPTSAKASPPVVIEGGKAVLPEKYVYMDGKNEMAIKDEPGFPALKELKKGTKLYCYLQGGKHEMAKLLFQDEKKTNWGPARMGSLAPYDFILANKEKLAMDPGPMSVLMAVSKNQGNLDAINFWDRSYVSFGMIGWAMHAGELARLLVKLKKKDQGVYDTYFGGHGLQVEEKDDKTIDVKLGEELLHNTAKEARGRTHLLSKLLMMKWAYLFHVAGKDPVVGEVEIAAALDRFYEFYDVPSIQVYDKPVKAWVTSCLGVALVYDLHVNYPAQLQKTLKRAAEAWKVTNSGVEYDASKKEHQDALLWNFVKERCMSRMSDPWNRADRILAVAQKRELAPKGDPLPGTTENWNGTWKELWNAGPAEAPEKYWGFTLSSEPGSFELKAR